MTLKTEAKSRHLVKTCCASQGGSKIKQEEVHVAAERLLEGVGDVDGADQLNPPQRYRNLTRLKAEGHLADLTCCDSQGDIRIEQELKQMPSG